MKSTIVCALLAAFASQDAMGSPEPDPEQPDPETAPVDKAADRDEATVAFSGSPYHDSIPIIHDASAIPYVPAPKRVGRSTATSLGIGLGSVALPGGVHFGHGVSVRRLRSRGRLGLVGRGSALVLSRGREGEQDSEGALIAVAGMGLITVVRHKTEHTTNELWAEAGVGLRAGYTSRSAASVGADLSAGIGFSSMWFKNYGERSTKGLGIFFTLHATAPISDVGQRGWQFFGGWRFQR